MDLNQMRFEAAEQNVLARVNRMRAEEGRAAVDNIRSTQVRALLEYVAELEDRLDRAGV